MALCPRLCVFSSQAICWTFTVEVLGGLGSIVVIAIRPDVYWAVIGTTTCISHSI
ncbi:hypothetical protein M405DRAFT_828957 [Rhizopogon salebrosus TDB-379]|nr:hypothetical protein M405DRAFT_828957 [Rhizopogon salebrosus TDB-379]